VKKYKQKIIPEIESDIFKNLNPKDFRKLIIKKYNEKLKGKSVINRDLGIKIEFINKGRNKISYGSILYENKAVTILILDKLMRYAEYNNWGDRKESDNDNIIGYLNFKAKAIINNKKEHIRISVIVTNTGKFHYHHEINKWKK